MKLIIDIPEEDYKFIKDLQNLIIGGRGSCKTIQMNVINAIRNGIPYEPKGDMISREALKEKLKPCEADVCEFSCEGCHFRVVTAEDIDNALTVEVSGLPKIHYDRGFIAGYEKGKTERPQGKWIIDQEGDKNTITLVTCPFCGERHCCKMNFCGNCGADMRGEEE